MYSKKEYLKSLESNAKVFLDSIDRGLRKGQRTFELGYLSNDEYDAIVSEITTTLEQAGWKVKVRRSTYKMDEGAIYLNVE